MKKILIIAPHWVPSVLVGIHRSRLIANHLKQFGWQSIVLTVNPKYYTEALAPELLKTVSKDVIVDYIDIKPLRKTSLMKGDVALRGLRQMRKRAIELIKQEKIDFLWVSIPSGYGGVIARLVHIKTGIPYGIDYRDPWVTSPPNGSRIFSKVWFAKQLAKLMEPFAVRKVAVLTGVSELTYLPIIDRNPCLKHCLKAAMPVGFSKDDFNILPENKELPWDNTVRPYFFAGSVPASFFPFWEKLFAAVKKLRDEGKFPDDIRFYFIGTCGNMTKLASRYSVDDIVIEKAERISYLQILYMLKNTAGLLAIGSPEPHFTASKIFQLLLSNKPILAIYHEACSVNTILQEANANNYLVKYSESKSPEEFEKEIELTLQTFIGQNRVWQPDLKALEKYSARETTFRLTKLIDKVLKK